MMGVCESSCNQTEGKEPPEEPKEGIIPMLPIQRQCDRKCNDDQLYLGERAHVLVLK